MRWNGGQDKVEPDEDEGEDLRRRLLRQASRGIVGGFPPPESPLASWFGDVRVGYAGEEWPASHGWRGARPWIPLCQINLTELPYCPERLSDVALLTVFIEPKGLPAPDRPNGSGWLLRAYPSLEGLTPLPRPDQSRSPWRIKPFPMRWELVPEDFPCWEDIAHLPMSDEREEQYHDLFENQEGTKVGGWPSLIQHGTGWAAWDQRSTEPKYVFQIASEPKAHWNWGDSGVAYFGRGIGAHADQWTMTWQCF